MFWGTTRQNGVFIIGIIKGKEVVILPTNIVVASSYAEEGLVFDKDWEKEITQKIVDIMLYGTPRPITDEKKTMINFLRTVNLTYVCWLICSFSFNMVMTIQGLRDYLSDMDKFCRYMVMVKEKANLPEMIFFN